VTFLGIIAGIIAVGVLALLEKLRVDDPVGAVAVHFAAGVWSTLAVGIFGKNNFLDYLKAFNLCKLKL